MKKFQVQEVKADGSKRLVGIPDTADRIENLAKILNRNHKKGDPEYEVIEIK